jgi:excisionase family DNA binding protein
MSNQESHPLLTLAEGSEILRLSPNTLNNWLSQGKIRRVKIGRKTFLDRAEIESMLNKALERQ